MISTGVVQCTLYIEVNQLKVQTAWLFQTAALLKPERRGAQVVVREAF